jgi:hypothetical protein
VLALNNNPCSLSWLRRAAPSKQDARDCAARGLEEGGVVLIRSHLVEPASPVGGVARASQAERTALMPARTERSRNSPWLNPPSTQPALGQIRSCTLWMDDRQLLRLLSGRFPTIVLIGNYSLA